jgi:hypothetical protein
LVGGFFYFQGPTTSVCVSFSGQKWFAATWGWGWLAPSGIGGREIKVLCCVVMDVMSCHVMSYRTLVIVMMIMLSWCSC